MNYKRRTFDEVFYRRLPSFEVATVYQLLHLRSWCSLDWYLLVLFKILVNRLKRDGLSISFGPPHTHFGLLPGEVPLIHTFAPNDYDTVQRLVPSRLDYAPFLEGGTFSFPHLCVAEISLEVVSYTLCLFDDELEWKPVLYRLTTTGGDHGVDETFDEPSFNVVHKFLAVFPRMFFHVGEMRLNLFSTQTEENESSAGYTRILEL